MDPEGYLACDGNDQFLLLSTGTETRQICKCLKITATLEGNIGCSQVTATAAVVVLRFPS